MWLAAIVVASVAVGGAGCAGRAGAPSAQASSPIAAATPAEPSADAPADPPADSAPTPLASSAADTAPLPSEPIASTLSPPCPPDPGRDARQKPDHVMKLVDLSSAMTVVDLGSGDGYFLCWLSRAVGPDGHVVATEISAPLVRDLKTRVAKEQLANVEVVRAPSHDVGISPGTADRILVVNVWHHLPDRKRYATRVARALSPGGKIVVVDFRPDRTSGGHGIAPERVLSELAAGGIDATQVDDDLSEQYVIIGKVRAPR